MFIRSEPGFDAAEDVDPLLLRFGASETVNLGGGCEPLRWKKKGDDLLVIFDAKGHGIAEDDFAGKLLGKTRGGELVVGFSKLK